MKYLLYILLFGLAACGRTSSPKSPLEEIEKIGAATMEEVVCLDSIGAFGVTDFAVQDSVLWLLFQRPGSEDVLARSRLGEGSFESVIKRGRGPGEMITITALDCNGHIALADSNTNVLATIGTDSVSYRQLPEGRTVSCIVNGNSVVSTGIYPEGRYRVVDLESGHAAYYGEYPRGEREIGRELEPTAYLNSKLAMKPDGTRFVCVNSNCGVVEIDSVADGKVGRVALIAYHYPEVTPVNAGTRTVAAIRKTNVNGFFDVTCSDEYIYAIYSGKTYNEAGLGLEHCDYLVAFDWSGKLLECSSVSPALSAIQFDNSQGLLYGLAHTPTRSLIYKVDLNR